MALIQSKFLTINTDASYYHNKKSGGYAFYLRSDAGVVKRWGTLNKVENPENAEIMSIGNAFTIAKQIPGLRTKIIIVNTDCIGAMKRLRQPHDELAKKVYMIGTEMMVLLGAESLIYKHVKAHSGTSTKRKWVNDWCDKYAKRGAKKGFK